MKIKKSSLELILSSDKIQERVTELGTEISKTLKGQNPILIGVLKGSFIFLADLIRNIKTDCEVDFVQLKSYDGKKSSDEVEVVKDISLALKDRHVIIVEDIIDTGQTLNFLYKKVKKKNPKSISIATFLIKPKVAKLNFNIDFIGFEISPDFVVGYGLDFNQKFRNLDSLYRFVDNG